MSFSRLVSRWQGVTLSLVAVVATVWLGLSGQLGLYINPAYSAFTIVMAAIACVLIVGAFATVPAEDEHAGHSHDGFGEQHGHEERSHDGHGEGDDHPPARHPRLRRTGAVLASAAVLVVIVAAVGVLLVAPPRTLTTAAVQQRDINSGTTNVLSAQAPQLAGADTAAFTVKDWAALIRQGVDDDTLVGQALSVTGFVTPDTDDPSNVFYVARFVITCCAVDAQPVGLAVYAPGWQKSYPTDSWVSVTGAFAADPSVVSTATLAVVPTGISAIPQPTNPYLN